MGGSSFLGSYLSKLLVSEGWFLVRTFRTEPPSLSQDILFNPDTDLSDIDYHAYDLIVNCISTGVQRNGREENRGIYFANLVFPILLIEHLKTIKYRGSIILFGSYFEIGNTQHSTSFSEEDIVRSHDPLFNAYAVSKRLQTQYVAQALGGALPFELYHFILPTIYGKGENSQRLIPYLIEKLKSNQIPNLTGGTQVRQYLYVKNAIAYIYMMIENKKIPADIYNLPADLTIDVKGLAIQIKSILESQIEINFGGYESGDTGMKRLVLNTKKIEKYAPYCPAFSFRQSILEY